MNHILELAERLAQTHDLPDDELLVLIRRRNPGASSFLKAEARALCDRIYGKEIYLRGLIEFTNFCKNDCYYCGIRKSNRRAERYRLTQEEVLACCDMGYPLGFRTFVLQGGEDPWFTDERLCKLVAAIKKRYPDCAVTLSVGERSRESYQRLFDAGADRYLLRHETATESHYKKLHPPELSLKNRLSCLQALRDIGYQTGCGFMVGSPFQTSEDLVRDLRFLKEFQPHMVGIGPYLSQRDTALGTLLPRGREEGILCGANVVMPNLSPEDARGKYLLYDNKLSSGAEAAESVFLLRESLENIGYRAVAAKGDSLVS